MKKFFITGIPTAGKSFLAKRLAKQVGGIAVDLDSIRESLSEIEPYRKWVNFYFNIDEKEYLTKVSPEDQWNNLVAQSEALWPKFLEKINEYSNEKRPVIFECVNILPHLAKRDLSFSGVVLVGNSLEETFARNKENPRWSNTLELQKLEAEAFFFVERPRYKAEAEKYGYPTFEDNEKAFEYALKLYNK